MALYANYIPNPSFELGTTSWASFNSGTLARVGSNAAAGSYALRIQRSGVRNVFGGVSAIVGITSPGQAHSLSLNISGATEEHGATYNAGIRVTVFDLLPGQAIGSRNQLATQTFARTTNGRVAVRNFTPRATADRIVIAVETTSTYFQDGGYTVTGPFTSYFSSESSAESFANSHYNSTLDYDYNGPGGTKRWIVQYYNRTEKPDIDGGQATVYVDAVKVEEGSVETAYVDGSTAGFVWEGEVHNSRTLNVVELAASGTGSLTNPEPVEIRPVAFLQASGSSELTGTIEMSAQGTVSATGEGGLTGSAELWNFGPLTASGTSELGGGIELYAIVPIEAHGEGGPGTGVYEPRIEMVKAWSMGASGYSELTGTIELSFPQPISASGEGSLTGTAHLDIGLQISASGFGSLFGTASLDDAIPAGAFTDFAIYSTAATDADPLKLGLGASNAGAQSGANGQPWTRIHGEFIAPADQPTSGGYAWRRAAYAAVGFRFNGMATNTYQELDCVQLEASTADTSPGPRPYFTAKTVRPLVHPDRANYADPDLWTFFGSTSISVTNGGTSPIPHDARPIRVLTVSSSGASGFFGANMVTPIPGTQCVASIYVKGSTTVSTVEVKVKGQNLDNIATSDPVFLPVDEWVRIVVPFVATDQDHLLAIEIPEVSTYPAVFYAAGYQVERGTTPNDYLGFIAGTRDHYYRDNGSDDTLGIFYYANLDERVPLVTTAISEHLPLSMRFGAPEFGLVPHLDY